MVLPLNLQVSSSSWRFSSHMPDWSSCSHGQYSPSTSWGRHRPHNNTHTGKTQMHSDTDVTHTGRETHGGKEEEKKREEERWRRWGKRWLYNDRWKRYTFLQEVDSVCSEINCHRAEMKTECSHTYEEEGWGRPHRENIYIPLALTPVYLRLPLRTQWLNT